MYANLILLQVRSKTMQNRSLFFRSSEVEPNRKRKHGFTEGALKNPNPFHRGIPGIQTTVAPNRQLTIGH